MKNDKSPTTANKPLANGVNLSLLYCDCPIFRTSENYELLLAVSGSIRLCADGKEELLSPGDCRLIMPGKSRAIVFGKRNEGLYLSLGFSEKQLENLLAEMGKSPKKSPYPLPRVALFSPDEVKKFTEAAILLAASEADEETKIFEKNLLANSLLCEFLLQNAPCRKAYPGWLSALLVLLDDPRCNLSADEIAATTPYSYSRLSRLFKAEIGMTLVEYIRKVKIDHACALLAHTDRSVVDIVDELHYESVSYFNHTFKDYLGVSPLQYRKNSRA